MEIDYKIYSAKPALNFFLSMHSIYTASLAGWDPDRCALWTTGSGSFRGKNFIILEFTQVWLLILMDIWLDFCCLSLLLTVYDHCHVSTDMDVSWVFKKKKKDYTNERITTQWRHPDSNVWTFALRLSRRNLSLVCHAKWNSVIFFSLIFTIFSGTEILIMHMHMLVDKIFSFDLWYWQILKWR